MTLFAMFDLINPTPGTELPLKIMLQPGVTLGDLRTRYEVYQDPSTCLPPGDPPPDPSPWIMVFSSTDAIEIEGGTERQIAEQIDPAVLTFLDAAGETTELVAPSEPASVQRLHGWPIQTVAVNHDTGNVSGMLATTTAGRITVQQAAGGATLPCPAGQIAVRCSGGVLHCATPCNGVVGDDPLRGISEDPSCALLAFAASSVPVTDEGVCGHIEPSGNACAPGTIQCALTSCVTPCNGVSECSAPPGLLDDESSTVCGSIGQSARTLSARRGELYVVDRDGDGLEQLTRVDLASGVTVRGGLAGVEATGREIALFYRLRDDKLYLVDEVTDGPRRSLRLVRLTRSGSGRELMRVRRPPGEQTIFLTGSYEGDLMLSVSGRGPLGRGHTLYAVLEPTEGGVRLAAAYLDLRPGTLALQPRTDSRAVLSVWKNVQRGPRSALELQEIQRASFDTQPRGLNWLLRQIAD